MRRRLDSAPPSVTVAPSTGLLVLTSSWVICAAFVLLFALPAEAQPGRVPIGPKGRVIKDCEWRYRHANVTDDVLSCKKCVKDYELRFPPRRLDVVKMRQTCVKPYTPKEAAIILCSAFHRPTEERTKCIRCVEDYDLPENATKIQQRELDWKCTPHQSPTTLLLLECRFRLAKNRENLTECERCVNETNIAENATFAEYKKVEADCMPRTYPKDRIRRLCKWRFIEEEEVHRCEECVDNYTLPVVFEYEDVWNMRKKCMPRPSRKELLRKTCDWYYKYQDVEKAECEACVEKSNLHEDASYAYEAQVRSICMPRKPPRERVKDACPRRFRQPEDIERCRKCAEEYMNDNNAANEVHSLDVPQLYRKCLSGNNLKYRLLEECQQKIQEPEVAKKCKDCIVNTYRWRIPEHLAREARKRCLLEGFQEN